jgi:hypothetical protein
MSGFMEIKQETNNDEAVSSKAQQQRYLGQHRGGAIITRPTKRFHQTFSQRGVPLDSR